MTRNLITGMVITGLFVLAAIVSLIWTPWPLDTLDIAHRLAPPSGSHWLGTDALGRDVLSLLMAGARNSLIVAVVSTAFALVIGTAIGLTAAARGGWLDAILMRVNDILFAFPALILAILIGAVLGSGLFNAALAIGLFNIPVFARLSRAQAQTLWPEPYVLAARLAGKGRARISIEHILPQLRGVLTTQALVQMAFSVAAESGLSYVGLGAVPPQPSWGRMIAEAQTLIAQAPVQSLSPCLAILLLVFGLNRLAEARK